MAVVVALSGSGEHRYARSTFGNSARTTNDQLKNKFVPDLDLPLVLLTNIDTSWREIENDNSIVEKIDNDEHSSEIDDEKARTQCTIIRSVPGKNE